MSLKIFVRTAIIFKFGFRPRIRLTNEKVLSFGSCVRDGMFDPFSQSFT